MTVPLATRRLFPEVRDSLLESGENVVFKATRLLESGDSNDLNALFSRLSEWEIRRIFAQRGRRQIDRRSCAFWALLFGQQPPERYPVKEYLWPL